MSYYGLSRDFNRRKARAIVDSKVLLELSDKIGKIAESLNEAGKVLEVVFD